MEISDFRSVCFSFENCFSFTLKKDDVIKIQKSDYLFELVRDRLFHKIEIIFKMDSDPIECWPKDEERLIHQPYCYIETYKGHGDLMSLIIEKEKETEEIKSYWFEMPYNCDSLSGFNLFQHEGFETDENYNLTGNYYVSFYSEVEDAVSIPFDKIVFAEDKLNDDYLKIKREELKAPLYIRKNTISKNVLYMSVIYPYEDSFNKTRVFKDYTSTSGEKTDRRIEKFILENSETIHAHSLGLISDDELIERLNNCSFEEK